MVASNAVTTLLSEVDDRTVAVELARLALETAHEELEKAREALDETLAKGDALGLAKGRLRKLGEERLVALIELGALPAARAGVLARVKPAEAPVRRPRQRAADAALTAAAALEVSAEAAVSVERSAVTVAVIDAGLVELPANGSVDAGAIEFPVGNAAMPLAETTAAVIDVGTIDFDALEPETDMDATAQAAILDLSAELHANPLAGIEAEVARADAALQAA
jgi:hypothetical protein